MPGRAAAAQAAQVGAGGGARCTVTGSCAPRPRGDIHRPAGPGSASAPRAAYGSAAARGPRTALRFAPSYFGGRWESAGGRGRLQAPGVRESERERSPSLLSLPQPPLCRSRATPGGSRRSGRWCGAPSRAGIPRRVRERLLRRQLALARSGPVSKASKKSLALRVCPQVPRRSRAAAAAAGEPRGSRGRASRGRRRAHPGERRAEAANRPAWRSGDARARRTTPKPRAAVLQGGPRETVTFSGSSTPGRAAVSLRVRAGAPRAVPGSRGRALTSGPATRARPAPSPATCREASISGKWPETKRGERARASGTSPKTTSEKPARASCRGSSLPPHARPRLEGEATTRILKPLPRRENK